MMVCDNDFDAIAIGQFNLCGCSDSVVAGNNQIHTVFFCLLNQMIIQAISIMYSVRNGSVHSASEGADSLGQYVRGAYPVHIIIPDNPDMRLIRNGLSNLLYCLIHILQKPGRMAILQRAIQKPSNLLLLSEVTISQDSGQYGSNMKFRCPLIKIGLLGCNKPFFHRFSATPPFPVYPFASVIYSNS